jgi:hypothetical protein
LLFIASDFFCFVGKKHFRMLVKVFAEVVTRWEDIGELSLCIPQNKIDQFKKKFRGE